VRAVYDALQYYGFGKIILFWQILSICHTALLQKEGRGYAAIGCGVTSIKAPNTHITAADMRWSDGILLAAKVDAS